MYKYIHTCIYIHIYVSAHIHTYTYMHTHIQNAHIHTYTYMHTHIQNVHMKHTQTRLERRRRSERARCRSDQVSFTLLFHSTQSTHISHLQCKDFIVPTSCSTNISTPHPLFPTYTRTVRSLRSFTIAPCVVVERLEGK